MKENIIIYRFKKSKQWRNLILLKMVDEGKLKLVFVNERLVLDKSVKLKFKEPFDTIEKLILFTKESIKEHGFQ